MIGCDIVEIKRFNKCKDRLAEKILTELEKTEYRHRKNKVRFLASRWAAKEAIFKCTNLKKNYSILTSKNGSPYVYEDPTIQISLSHENNYCLAFALKI